LSETPPTSVTHHLTFPLSHAQVSLLHAGDLVYLNGEIVITAGLPTHRRILEYLDAGKPLPIDLHGAALFHIGSYSRESQGKFEILYINPTTSTRFNPFMPRFIREFGLCAVGGKGGLDAECTRAMREAGCVYLSFLGGSCTLLSEAIREVISVSWNDLIPHYRLAKLRVEELGPATVGIDAHGRSIYDELQVEAKRRLPAIMAALDKERAER
jgi:fumarate hydratase subunit beta